MLSVVNKPFMLNVVMLSVIMLCARPPVFLLHMAFMACRGSTFSAWVRLVALKKSQLYVSYGLSRSVLRQESLTEQEGSVQ